MNKKPLYWTFVDFRGILLRTIDLLVIIPFSLYIRHNVFAFTIIILLFIALFINIKTKQLKIYSSYVLICHDSVIPFLSKKDRICYNSIHGINCYVGWLYCVPKVLLFVPPFLRLFTSIELYITLKNGQVKLYDLEGLRWKSVKKCLKIIESKLDQEQGQSVKISRRK